MKFNFNTFKTIMILIMICALNSLSDHALVTDNTANYYLTMAGMFLLIGTYIRVDKNEN